MDLKDIRIEDHQLEYSSEWYYDQEDYPVTPYTQFYYGKHETKHKKYWLFGEIITKVHNTPVFNIDFHLNDPNMTTEEVKNKILKAYERWINLKNRQEDLKIGKLF